jgi:hypothetical protein
MLGVHNLLGADCREILVLSSKLFAAAKTNRYPDQSITLFDATTASISQRLRVPIWIYDFPFDVINSIIWR